MKLSETFCRSAIASGAIIPPPRPAGAITDRLSWGRILACCLIGTAMWVALAWLVTLVWWLM